MKILFKNKPALTVFTVILTAFVLVSCSSSNMTKDGRDVVNMQSQTYAADMDMAPAESGGSFFGYVAEEEKQVLSDSATSNGAALDQNISARKIIYSSWYNISTEEYDKSIAALSALCDKYGAYFERSESYGGKESYSNRHSSYTVRIPIQNYHSFITATGNIGTVVSSGENNRDVTESYFDTEARLESAQLREERLLEILSKADELSDVLLLEKELSDVRYEIESFSGTLRKYDSLISYSTAEININEVKKVVVPDSEKLTLPTRMSNAFSRGLDIFKSNLDDLIIDLTFSAPTIIFVWIPFIIFVVVIALVVRNVLKKKKAKTEIKEALTEENPKE